MFRCIWAVGCLFACASVSAQAVVFINELHYDNASTDQNEAVEVAGPANTDLTGWSLVLYNGNGGASYTTLPLPNTIPDLCGGFGTVNVPAPGLQNGSPDGVALVNGIGTVVQFLSYEGVFAATNGPASGMTSIDIGVSEDGTGPVTSSLALIGTGSTYQDFTWGTATAASFGACNTGQTFTGGVDNAPSVQSTTPTDGATGVAISTNVTLTFSEPVSVSGPWFEIMCSVSGVRPVSATVVSGSSRVFTINPNVDFTGNESCTLTVIASKVTDIDGTPTLMVSNYVMSFGVAGTGTGYYASVNATSSANLRATLHPVIDDHTKIPYTASTTDVWDVLNAADQDPLNSSRVLDVYKNASYAKQAGGNTFYNREHTWPKSLGFPDDGASNYPYSDTHMLMVSDIAHNSARGNLPFNNCPAGSEVFATLAYYGQGGSGQNNLRCGNYWQVWDKLKGNVARAMFYFDIRYEGGTHGVTGVAEPNLILTDNASLITASNGNASVAYMGLLSVLLQWHAADPVDDRERLRNETVFNFQGNRNPFVDRPEWVACLFQNVCP